MGKGFAPVLPTGNKAQLKPELPLTSINEIRQFKNEVHQCLMIIHRIPQKGFDSQDIFEDDD